MSDQDDDSNVGLRVVAIIVIAVRSGRCSTFPSTSLFIEKTHPAPANSTQPALFRVYRVFLATLSLQTTPSNRSNQNRFSPFEKIIHVTDW